MGRQREEQLSRLVREVFSNSNGIGVSTIQNLERRGILNVRDLIERGSDGLIAITGFGSAKVRLIDEELKRKTGFGLGTDLNEVEEPVPDSTVFAAEDLRLIRQQQYEQLSKPVREVFPDSGTLAFEMGRGGIRTIRDLIEAGRGGLLRLSGIGPGRVRLIDRELKRLTGLGLDTDLSTIRRSEPSPEALAQPVADFIREIDVADFKEVTRSLGRIGVRNVGDFAGKQEEDLLTLGRVDPADLGKIAHGLKLRGIYFAGSDPECLRAELDEFRTQIKALQARESVVAGKLARIEKV